MQLMTYVYIFLAFYFLSVGVLLYFLLKLLGNRKKDQIIFLDKNNRWRIQYAKLSGLDSYTEHKKKYYLKKDKSLLNVKGRALYVFSEGKPEPMNLEYNKTTWLDSDALNGAVTNDVLTEILQPSDKLKDTILILGAIGGMIAGMSGVISLLISTGVITL